MGRAKKFAFIVIYLMMVAFITIYVRTPNLAPEPINTRVFLSLERAIGGSTYQIRQILLNVALFIPLGCLLVDLTGQKVLSILIAPPISLLIECIQYFSCRGQFDVDDLIYNTIGGVLGVLLFQIVRRWNGRRVVPYALLIAGVAGCFIAVPRSEDPTKYAKQFDFYITSVIYSDNEVKVNGICEIYGGETPHYDLFLDDLKMNTVTENDHFNASAAVDEGKHEIYVKFPGYSLISTGTYISLSSGGQIKVEYVPGDVVIPFSVPDNYILKAYNPNLSTYVFQDNDRLLWYIDWEITPSTEVIYHIFTDEPEKLPEKRKQYGFDNRGFRVGKLNELESENSYRVFEREIPENYYVTSITVGFNTAGEITWVQSFRVEK